MDTNKTEVVVRPARPANQNAGNNAYTPDAYGTPSFNSAQSASFEEIPNDESLPF